MLKDSPDIARKSADVSHQPYCGTSSSLAATAASLRAHSTKHYSQQTFQTPIGHHESAESLNFRINPIHQTIYYPLLRKSSCCWPRSCFLTGGGAGLRNARLRLPDTGVESASSSPSFSDDDSSPFVIRFCERRAKSDTRSNCTILHSRLYCPFLAGYCCC